MENRDQKEIWEEESRQLKKDFDNRPKEVRRREVQIRVGKPSKKKLPSLSEKSPKLSDSDQDNLLRKKLGIG